jgi:hypothetical protein
MPRWFRWLGFLAPLCIFGSAIAAFAQQVTTQPSGGQISAYAVDGFALGSRVQVRGSTYREYECPPSDQFDGFTWCQKILQDRERRGSFTATYSILHAADGNVVYANRYQEPAFFGPGEANDDIRSYARQFGGTPEVIQILPRNGIVGQIALWGSVILKVLDNDSMRILGEGKGPKKGLLIDFIGDFTSSVRAGLPVYRISGGAGFVWIASYDQRGRGTLRFAAVDVSKILPQNQVPQNADAPTPR